MIRALLFDAAGTLIRPTEPVAVVYARILAHHGNPLSPATLSHSFNAAFATAGDPDYDAAADGEQAEREWWRRVVDATLGQAADEATFTELYDHYAQPSAWQVFPDAIPALTTAQERGLRLAVVSNFDCRLRPILEAHQLERYFDFILTSADACARKPSPRIFEQALKQLKLTAGEALHVGDSWKPDIDGAASVALGAFHLNRPSTSLLDFLQWAENWPVK